jgi:hypothetical protein
MKRTFDVDVLLWECGARRAVISCITDRSVARAGTVLFMGRVADLG